jgi:TRAP-type C4-dicarboxylate transport system permease small subunit
MRVPMPAWARALDRLVRFGAGAALAAASLVMLLQVSARFVFSAPFSWPEELATLLFAWITFLGAAAVQRDDSHLSIDTLRTHVSPPARRRLDALRRVVIAACCAVLVYQGIALSLRMWPLEFPALGVTRSLLYLSVPVGLACALVFALRSLRTGEPPGGVAVAVEDLAPDADRAG